MSLRPRDRLALAVVVGLALAGGFYLVALRPELDRANSLKSAISAQQANVSAAQEKYAQGRAAQAALRASAKELKAVTLAVPTEANIPSLLRLLQRTATEANVKMQSLVLSGASSAGTGSSGASSSSSSGTASGATAVPVQLTFTGGYQRLDELLSRINQFVVPGRSNLSATGPLVSVGSLELNGTGTLTAQLSASIYQLSSSSSTGAATTTGGNQ